MESFAEAGFTKAGGQRDGENGAGKKTLTKAIGLKREEKTLRDLGGSCEQEGRP